MALNLCDPEIKVILRNDTTEKHYSADCLPQKLVDPSTEKSSRFPEFNVDNELDDNTIAKEVINIQASQHNISDTDGISCASGETTDIHVSHDQPTKLLPSTILCDSNNNSSCIDKCDLERIESCFSNAILKLENSCMDNTDKIITALYSKIDTLKLHV
ncbi:unnamed protein product [Mytilus coruscus]|uniref:Uncharacterized protein n=1 Tax=Mytilus coruscus TaxID=42192 RepID=A0A6J8DLU8_MYTCO|nr:unnamed protein product [Mytilus coruscus]